MGINEILSDKNRAGKYEKSNSSGKPAIFEVKYKNKFRNFRTSLVVYYERNENNMLKEAARIQFGMDLFKYFATIFKPEK